MASKQDEPAAVLTRKCIEAKGNLEYPLVPDLPFATVRLDALPKGVTGASLAGAIGPETNMRYNESMNALVALVPGKLADGPTGLWVQPLWTVSEDWLRLTIDVYPRDCFGSDLDVGQLVAAMTSVLGEVQFDRPLLERTILESRGEDKPRLGVVLAEGTPPKQGVAGSLRLFFTDEAEVGKAQDDGSLDFRERGGMASVNGGDLLAEEVPPTRGAPGKDIKGRPIPPGEGAAVVLTVGTNVAQELGETGGLIFRATAPGVVRYANNTLLVSDLFEVSGDVDMASGNVHAEKGSVSIKGTVTTGSSVTAKDNIFVGAVVEDATIKAGGDLEVKGGIIMEGASVIEVGGSVRARFIRNAVIRAGGDVVVEVDIANSDIIAGGRVLAESEKGAIVGGTTVSSAGIEASEIGNDRDVPTAVELRLASDDTVECLDKLKNVRERLAQFDKLVGKGDPKSTLLLAPEEDRRLLAALFMLRKTLLEQEAALLAERDEIIARQGEDWAKLRIRARKTAYPRTTLTLAGKSITLKKAEQASTFQWDSEKGGIAIFGA
ncbi:MAG: DUF342 domain-containing protein [Desulfovibrionaceae bacterium]